MRFGFLTLFILLLGACASDKPPATDSGPAKTGGEVEAEVSGPAQPWLEMDDAPESQAGADICRSDADCVEAECCHPVSCTLASARPDCSGVACSDQCEGGTLDCGQGHCACQNGSCVAVMASMMPAP